MLFVLPAVWFDEGGRMSGRTSDKRFGAGMLLIGVSGALWNVYNERIVGVVLFMLIGVIGLLSLLGKV